MGEAETSEALNAGMLASTIHNFSKQEQTATETQQVLQAKDICTLKQQLISFELRLLASTSVSRWHAGRFGRLGLRSVQSAFCTRPI